MTIVSSVLTFASGDVSGLNTEKAALIGELATAAGAASAQAYLTTQVEAMLQSWLVTDRTTRLNTIINYAQTLVPKTATDQISGLTTLATMSSDQEARIQV